MEGLPELKTSKSFTCARGLLMPDGNGWCSITMSFCYGCSDNFKPGGAKLYKKEPIQTEKQIIRSVKPKETKPKEPKPKPVVTKTPVKSSKKTKPGQTRLF